MRITKTIYISACALALMTTLSGCATYQKCGFHGCPGDADLGKAVQESIDQHTGLGTPNAIRATAIDHVVYLNGQVDYGLEKSTAESVAKQVLGVTTVVNNISVQH